jgi:hypothetical protein
MLEAQKEEFCPLFVRLETAPQLAHNSKAPAITAKTNPPRMLKRLLARARRARVAASFPASQ